MYTIGQALFDSSLPRSVRQSIFDYAVQDKDLGQNTPILIPSSTNNDANGSQHAQDGGTDFTYDAAGVDDVANATTLGVYDYFSGYGNRFTGHYYQGDRQYFAALVVDPPAYAVGAHV